VFFYEVIKECTDPIEEAISAQLANPDFNDYPGPEGIICQAIDEKRRRIPIKLKIIFNLKKQGYTFVEIARKVNYSERHVRRMFRKMSAFPDFKPL